VADLSWGDVAIRLVAAAFLGAAIGVERELDGQEAGIRTHLMLALGAAVFGVISVGAFDSFHDSTGNTNFRVDVTRVASYVAAGIGFLGGGVIVKRAGAVRGLTTAASLWVAAAIGLACGVGFFAPPVIAAAIALLALLMARPVRMLTSRLQGPTSGHLVVVLAHDADLAEVVRSIRELPIHVQHFEIGHGESPDRMEIAIDVADTSNDLLADCAVSLSKRPDVSDARIGRN
jgi:putative Mg2+ transporter-C (MgtC) family protein